MSKTSARGLRFLVAIAALVAAAIGTPGYAASSSQYFTPAVKPGQRLETIFSKAIAITGPDFEPLVRRISGTASDEIEKVMPEAITVVSQYVYDGHPPGSGKVTIRNHGITDCVAGGKCVTNDQTSASMFDSLLWGPVPGVIAVGSTWSVKVHAAWEIGPAGEEEVSVARLEPSLGLVTLVRRGQGAGRSSDDAARSAFTITSHGRAIKVRLRPGRATWTGRATFVHGVTLADEILLTRAIELVSDDGRVFRGSERIYTIFTEA